MTQLNIFSDTEKQFVSDRETELISEKNKATKYTTMNHNIQPNEPMSILNNIIKFLKKGYFHEIADPTDKMKIRVCYSINNVSHTERKKKIKVIENQVKSCQEYIYNQIY